MNGSEDRHTGQSSREEETERFDELIGERYRIIRKIGSGGMGDVYLAEHVILGKKVAIKILFSNLSRRKEILERFTREAIAASNIGQANIVDVTDFGFTDEGNAYFVMEYIDGKSLAALLTGRNPLGVDFIVSVSAQIAQALYRTHQKGIIHRDLKPENVLITENNGVYPFVKIVDFGISKIHRSNAERSDRKRTLTKDGAIFGTPEYMSPEQAGGNSVVPASDVYSLGVIMYEMATGDLPFSDDNYMKLLHKHMYELPALPSSRNPDIPERLDAIIMRCLEKNTANRYASMRELFEDLVEFNDTMDTASRINLAALYGDTAISMKERKKKKTADFSPSDITRMLNSSGFETLHDEETQGTNLLKFALTVVFLLSLMTIGAFGVFKFLQSEKPLVVERVIPDNHEQKQQKSAKKRQAKHVKKSRKRHIARTKTARRRTITLRVKSNMNGVEVINRDNGKVLCVTPCKTKLKRSETDILMLSFRKDNFRIKPMVIRLDQDMTITVNLKQETE